jgi:sugar phosphate isomerase/epimerase
MKLGFLQGGMPPWTSAEVTNKASELGFDGVGIGSRQLGQSGAKSSDDELSEIRLQYEKAGIEIHNLGAHYRAPYPGIGSDEFNWDELEAELVPIAQLASKLGSPSISVTVQRPVQGKKWDWTEYLDNLGRASLRAVQEVPGVRAVFQNHVTSASARQLLEMVERVGDERLGVAFSPDHCIVMQEDPVELADRHAAAIQHVCMADRKVTAEDLGKFDGRYYYVRYECCVVGEGVVPTERMIDTLIKRGFDGYVSLKWEKSDAVSTAPDRAHLPNGYGWHLPPGEEVLPPFAELMRSLGVGQRSP